MGSEAKRIRAPFDDATIQLLRAGDRVLITGTMLVARDAAHKRLVELLKAGQPLPVDVKGQVIYYAGPSPAKPGHVSGSVGPTTAGRMDAYTPALLEQGLKGMIGKGARSPAVKEAMMRHGAIYLASVGGAGALLARRIKASQVLAYPELGPEAIRLIAVEDFPAVVINDIYGGDLYQQGVEQYRRPQGGSDQ